MVRSERMRIEDLQYFMKVVEVGNMTQAAKDLFIAQPSLSKAMANLESEMGVALFQRTAKGTVLTVQGRNSSSMPGKSWSRLT